ncbi:ABC transporter ATP-binding protein [Ramlibacter sp. USB13]|uniref:ABC transporter ATP-binding protein n=1 Tax=Ramlibacter cellulosilyticus TaxID=2764187 RepID=A0A923MXK5_9BURK|nr:ABC transporter ATP-binding protein [Ramlibacter cellulosilyticus]MBC5785989.1 ABC transporter ATP-binding protein [Ramlibacter cellulosilyticus]
MAAPLLEVRNLRAGYGPTEVLHGLDFAIPEGSITALLGANGAGKTTTLRAICGMVRTSGEVSFAGQRISGKSTEDIVRLGVAHVPDGRGTFTDLTTEENLRLGAYARREHGALAEDYGRMYRLFPILAERRHQQAGTLSGGQQQMLAVARALMLRPRLLLLDEPSFGLAPMVVKEIFEVMREINRSQKMTILLVEQNAAMALKLADQAHLLETGRIVRSGAGAELMNDDAVRRAYLGY